MSLDESFAQLKDHCHPTHDVHVQWTAKGIGFGEFYFYENDGKLYCDNEAMSKDFIKRMLCQMVDDCILSDPRD